MAKSPGINIIEKDTTPYTTTSSDTMLAVVGYASKGPVAKPTLISGKTKFIETFGTPASDNPHAGITAINAFDYTDKVLFYRITDGTETAAACVVVPTVYGTATFDNEASIIVDTDEVAQADDQYFVNKDTGLTITLSNGKVGTLAFKTPVSGPWAIESLFESLKTQLSLNPILYKDIKVELLSKKIVFTSLKIGVGISSVVPIAGAETNDLVKSLGGSAGLVITAASVTVGGLATDPARKCFLIKAKEKGSSTNLISVVKSSRKSPADQYTLIHKIEVFLNGKLKETFDNISFTTIPEGTGPDSFMLSADSSEYVTFTEAETGEAFPAFPYNFPDGEYILGASNYGTADVEYVDNTTPYTYRQGEDGVASSQTGVRTQFITAFAVDGDLGNSELYDFHVLVTPGFQDEVIQDAAVALADSRKDFIYIADTPINYSYKEAVNWHNGNDSARASQLVSSYAAVYAPWVKVTNPSTGEATWVPPSVVVSKKYLEIDKLYGPWAAPAGDNRGVLAGVSDYEYSASKAQRDELYGDPNTINPIVFFNTKGIEIYGEKTCLREEGKAMSRVHVRRLVIYVSKLLRKILDGFIYEPNSAATWARANERINSMLDVIRNAGGLSTYQVIIDGTNNTAESILENKMNVVVRLVPFGVVETIEVNLSVDMTGATIV